MKLWSYAGVCCSEPNDGISWGRIFSCYLHILKYMKYNNTVKPVWNDHPCCYEKVVFQDRWSLLIGAICMDSTDRKKSSLIGKWTFLTGWSFQRGWLKAGFTANCKSSMSCADLSRRLSARQIVSFHPATFSDNKPWGQKYTAYNGKGYAGQVHQ